MPRSLKDTTLPFTYNNFSELKELVDNNDIGVIKMEVQRTEPPKEDFLRKVRDLATEKNIVLIFDECTSGFRETFGGLHKKFNIEPDIAIFGKALGNGYAITSILGRQEVMEAAQSTFISSTFWTERIGPTAALKTLEIMEREESWQQITQTGKEIRKGWQRLADQYSIEISHWGLPALAGFTIHSDYALIYKTFITQEMQLKGYLATNCVYVCIDHTPTVIESYFTALEPLFDKIQKCEQRGDVGLLLTGPVCHDGFKRLN